MITKGKAMQSVRESAAKKLRTVAITVGDELLDVFHAECIDNLGSSYAVWYMEDGLERMTIVDHEGFEKVCRQLAEHGGTWIPRERVYGFPENYRH